MEPGPPGSETTLLRVFREQRPRIWGFLLRAVASPELAEDLLQETFLRAWDHRAEFDDASVPRDREAVRRYVWRVVRNLAIDEIRARARQRRAGERLHLVGELSDNPAPDPGPDEQVEHADCLRAVRESVERLPNRRARACLRLWLEGRGLAEIASRLRIGVGQARGLLQRGKAEVLLRAADRLRAGPEREGKG